MSPGPRPGIRRRWYALAVLAGATAAAATWVWLDGPTWRTVAASPGSLPHFSRDGRTLTTCHGRTVQPGGLFAPRLIRWDTATGRKLGEVPIAWEGPQPPPGEHLAVTFLPDDERVVVGVTVPDPRRHYVFYVHDAGTGRRAAGPVEGDHGVNSCSADGRWFMALQDGYKGVAIVAAQTGATALRLRAGADAFPMSVAFAPAGDQVAVHWRPKAEGGPHAVVIYELPSGREVRRLELPQRPWQRVNEWADGGRLYAEINEPDGPTPGHYFRRSYLFSLADADFGAERAEPLLAGHVAGTDGQTYWDSGPGWVAHIDLVPSDQRAPVERALDWLDRTLKTSLAPPRVMRNRVRVSDAVTGGVRCEVPLVTHPSAISPDGRWVASAGKTIEVWAVPPPWRAPRAAGAALLAAGAVVLIGRRRARETAEHA